MNETQLKDFRNGSSRRSEPKPERMTYDVGTENWPLPICHSLPNSQNMRLSEELECRPKAKMVSIRRQKLCSSYRTIHLALLVP